MQEKVILVDEDDKTLGVMEKMEAHRKGLLHRAFSIYLFNSKGELLLQKRASGKYHSGGLWTNTCCSHPRPNEELLDAAMRRLREEMGINAGLKEVCDFSYKAILDKGMIEHELLHVYAGLFEGEANPDMEEAEDWKYVDPLFLLKDVKANAASYTEWFKITLPYLFDEKGQFKYELK